MLKPLHLEPESENTYLLKKAICFSFRLLQGITQTFTAMFFHLVQYKFLQLFTIVPHEYLTDVRSTEVRYFGGTLLFNVIKLYDHQLENWKLSEGTEFLGSL